MDNLPLEKTKNAGDIYIYFFFFSFSFNPPHTHEVGGTAISFEEETGRHAVTCPRSHSRWRQSWDLTQAFLSQEPLPALSAYIAFQRRRLKITGNSFFFFFVLLGKDHWKFFFFPPQCLQILFCCYELR